MKKTYGDILSLGSPKVTVNQGQDRVTIMTKDGQEFEILIDKDKLTIGGVTGTGDGLKLKVTRLKKHTNVVIVRQEGEIPGLKQRELYRIHFEVRGISVVLEVMELSDGSRTIINEKKYADTGLLKEMLEFVAKAPTYMFEYVKPGTR